jgi:aldehyde dehydrogenase
MAGRRAWIDEHGFDGKGFLRGEMNMATATALHPGKLSETMSFRSRYGNYIGGKWVEPASGQYFENVTPVTGRAFCEIPRSNAQDIDRALDAAHAARAA